MCLAEAKNHEINTRRGIARWRVSLCKRHDHNHIDQKEGASNCEAERWLKN